MGRGRRGRLRPLLPPVLRHIDNVSLEALDINADAIAYAVLNYAMNTEPINGVPGKGNFRGQANADDPAATS